MKKEKQIQIKKKIKSEIIKSIKDPIHFMKNYCYIQHPIRGKIKFNLFPFQEDTLEKFITERFNIILKSRQLGISTLCAAFIFWKTLFHEDYTVLLIATKSNVAAAISRKVRIMYNELPEWFKSKSLNTIRIENNVMSQGFSNGSRVVAESCTEESGRGGSYSSIIIDEGAFIKEKFIVDLWSAAFPTLSTGGSAIILSTPNGQGNWFHRMWVDAVAGINKFNTITLHWTVHPDRNQKWRDEQTLILGEEMAAQECDTNFMTSGTTLIKTEILNYYKNEINKKPIEKRGPNESFWIWEYPKLDVDYLVVADVARGDGRDYSAFQVFDIKKLEQVAEYKDKINTKVYGKLLCEVATEWNNALLVVENANIGWAVLQEIIDLEYNNLYYTVKDFLVADKDVYTKKKYDLKNKEDMVVGFTTSSKTRPLIIERMETYMRQKVPIIYSERLINELFTFLWIKGKPQAEYGYNDDLVMTLAIAIWIRETALKLRQAGKELHKKTLTSISNSRTNNGVYNSRNTHKDPFKVSMGGQIHDFRWLL